MKLKPLALVVALLALAAGLVCWRNHASTTAPAADPRVGQPLVALDTLQSLRGLRLVSGGQSVVLAADPDGRQWTVPDYFAFPADFGKLATLVESLRGAKIARLVTTQPERLARLGFAGDLIELRGADARPLLTIRLGRKNESGGRFIQLGDEPKAYLADLDAWLEPVAKNWARNQLLDVKPESVATLEFRFADGSALAAKRTADATAWTADALPAGKELKAETLDALVAQLTTLRFTETAEPTAPAVLAAREHTQTVVLTLKDGTSYTIALGRRPAPPAPVASAQPKEAAAAKPPATPESEAEPEPAAPIPASAEPAQPPANPVFAFIAANRDADPLNALMQKRAFEVSEWTLTGLPATCDALFQDKSAAVPAPATGSVPAAAEPPPPAKP